MVLSGCSFTSGAAGDFKPPDCAQTAPIADGIIAALALGGCIAIAATDDGRAVIPRSLLCVPLGTIALLNGISGLYGVSKRASCRDPRPRR